MAENKSQDSPVTGIAVVVAIICAIAGGAKGGWPLAITGAVVGFGAVHLAVRILGLAIFLLAGAAVLGVLALIFMNNVGFLRGLFP